MRTSGVEAAKVVLRGPDGAVNGELATTPGNGRRSLKVEVPANHTGVWSMEIGKAAEGLLEDVRIYLAGDVVPLVSFVPELVFRQRAAAE
jgi:hypothetical protein